MPGSRCLTLGWSDSVQSLHFADIPWTGVVNAYYVRNDLSSNGRQTKVDEIHLDLDHSTVFLDGRQEAVGMVVITYPDATFATEAFLDIRQSLDAFQNTSNLSNDPVKHSSCSFVPDQDYSKTSDSHSVPNLFRASGQSRVMLPPPSASSGSILVRGATHRAHQRVVHAQAKVPEIEEQSREISDARKVPGFGHGCLTKNTRTEPEMDVLIHHNAEGPRNGKIHSLADRRSPSKSECSRSGGHDGTAGDKFTHKIAQFPSRVLKDLVQSGSTEEQVLDRIGKTRSQTSIQHTRKDQAEARSQEQKYASSGPSRTSKMRGRAAKTACGPTKIHRPGESGQSECSIQESEASGSWPSTSSKSAKTRPKTKAAPVKRVRKSSDPTMTRATKSRDRPKKLQRVVELSSNSPVPHEPMRRADFDKTQGIQQEKNGRSEPFNSEDEEKDKTPPSEAPQAKRHSISMNHDLSAVNRQPLEVDQQTQYCRDFRELRSPDIERPPQGKEASRIQKSNRAAPSFAKGRGIEEPKAFDAFQHLLPDADEYNEKRRNDGASRDMKNIRLSPGHQADFLNEAERPTKRKQSQPRLHISTERKVSLVNDNSARRPGIISFERSGPQNQAYRPSKKCSAGFTDQSAAGGSDNALRPRSLNISMFARMQKESPVKRPSTNDAWDLAGKKRQKHLVQILDDDEAPHSGFGSAGSPAGEGFHSPPLPLAEADRPASTLAGKSLSSLHKEVDPSLQHESHDRPAEAAIWQPTEQSPKTTHGFLQAVLSNIDTNGTISEEDPGPQQRNKSPNVFNLGPEPQKETQYWDKPGKRSGERGSAGHRSRINHMQATKEVESQASPIMKRHEILEQQSDGNVRGLRQILTKPDTSKVRPPFGSHLSDRVSLDGSPYGKQTKLPRQVRSYRSRSRQIASPSQPEEGKSAGGKRPGAHCRQVVAGLKPDIAGLTEPPRSELPQDSAETYEQSSGSSRSKHRAVTQMGSEQPADMAPQVVDTWDEGQETLMEDNGQYESRGEHHGPAKAMQTAPMPKHVLVTGERHRQFADSSTPSSSLQRQERSSSGHSLDKPQLVATAEASHGGLSRGEATWLTLQMGHHQSTAKSLASISHILLIHLAEDEEKRQQMIGEYNRRAEEMIEELRESWTKEVEGAGVEAEKLKKWVGSGLEQVSTQAERRLEQMDSLRDLVLGVKKGRGG